MTYHLVHSDRATLLASDTPVIKRAERADFADAVSLLQVAGAIRDTALAEAERARAAGHAEGLAEARSGMDVLLADQIAGFAEAIERREEARRADIAQAAFAAVQTILGELEDETIVPRMVERTLARLPDDGPVAIQTAPAMAERLAETFAAFDHVTIAANPDLQATDCVLRTRDGQVIASLSVQLDTLARRWGVEP